MRTSTTNHPWRAPARPRALGVAAESLRAVLDLTLPLVCASCARPGAPCCADCLAACGWPGGTPLTRSPRPRPSGLPTTWAGGPYDGPLRRLLVAYKDGDRRDLREPLAAFLRPVLRSAAEGVMEERDEVDVWEELGGADEPAVPVMAARPALLLVPVPSSPASRRRRGDAPLADLVATAIAGPTRGSAGRHPDLLQVRRRVADQAGLDAQARAANLSGAFGATRAGAVLLPGRECLLVDDVLTTGATLVEAARAVRAAGGRPVAAAVLAATPRRRAARAARRSGRPQPRATRPAPS